MGKSYHWRGRLQCFVRLVTPFHGRATGRNCTVFPGCLRSRPGSSSLEGPAPGTVRARGAVQAVVRVGLFVLASWSVPFYLGIMVFALPSWGGGFGVAVLAFLSEYGVCGGLTL